MIDPDEILDEKDYDAGLMNDYGGGNVEWWHDYIRSEIGRCNDYWRSIIESYKEQQAYDRDCDHYNKYGWSLSHGISNDTDT
jgi:hypothetical protein